MEKHAPGGVLKLKKHNHGGGGGVLGGGQQNTQQGGSKNNYKTKKTIEKGGQLSHHIGKVGDKHKTVLREGTEGGIGGERDPSWGG